MKTRKNSQALIEQHLLQGNAISQLGALTRRFHYAGRLSSIIQRLRRKHDIVTEMVATKDGNFGRYILRKFSKKK